MWQNASLAEPATWLHEVDEGQGMGGQKLMVGTGKGLLLIKHAAGRMEINTQ